MLVNSRCFPDEVILNRHLADVQYVCYLGMEYPNVLMTFHGLKFILLNWMTCIHQELGSLKLTHCPSRV